MTNPQENGCPMSDLPDWLRDFVSVVELKQHQGYAFYVAGEISQDSEHIVKSMWKGITINAVKQKI